MSVVTHFEPNVRSAGNRKCLGLYFVIHEVNSSFFYEQKFIFGMRNEIRKIAVLKYIYTMVHATENCVI